MFPLGPVWSRKVPHGPMPYGTIWSRIVPYGPVWPRMVTYRPAWSRMVPYGPVWPCMAPYRPLRSRILPYAPVWCIMTQYCACLFPIWFHIVPHGPVLPSGVLYGHVWLCMALYNLLFFLDCKYCLIANNLFSLFPRFSKWMLLIIVTCGQSEKQLFQNKIQQSHLSAAKDSKLYR